MSLAAYLLCAGYGQRLRPLTDRIAKPAITFLGKSALEINKFAIEKLSPKHWLANVHHLPHQMGALAVSQGMEIIHEPEILGTGGCIYNAASILDKYDTFLVHNADLIHTLDLTELFRRHLGSGAIATLAGIFRPAFNTLSMSEKGRLLGIHGYDAFDRMSEMTRLTFAGIAFYQRDFLKYVSPGPEDIKRHWVNALKSGAHIQVVNCSHEGSWYDFGTPQGLWEASKFMMEATGEFSYNYHPLLSETKPYVSNEPSQEDLPDLLRNVLICEQTGFPVPSGTQHCILGLDYKWEILP